jgi:hypothetical protein
MTVPFLLTTLDPDFQQRITTDAATSGALLPNVATSGGVTVALRPALRHSQP